MTELLVLPTERDDVVLRQLATPEDDRAYWDAVEANREHLSQFGDTTSSKYKKLKDVTNARLNAGSKIRLGILGSDTFVGSINATPENDEVEIGYWLDARYTGRGYMTLAARSLTTYLQPRYRRVFAEVHVANHDSTRVLQRAGYVQVAEVEKKWGRAKVLEPINRRR